MTGSESHRFRNLCLLFLLLLLGTIALSSCIGRYGVTGQEILSYLQGQDSMGGKLCFRIRLPRILFVVLSGGALALAGTVYQNLFHNPLVSPDLLGVTSGCSLGAAIAIVFFAAHPNLVQSLAFLLGLCAVSLFLGIARLSSGDQHFRFRGAGLITSALALSL